MPLNKGSNSFMAIVTSILLFTILCYALVFPVMLALLSKLSLHKQITLQKPQTLFVPNICFVQQSVDSLYSDKPMMCLFFLPVADHDTNISFYLINESFQMITMRAC